MREREWEIVDPKHDRATHTFNFTTASGPQLQLPTDAKPYEYYTYFLGDDYLAMMISGVSSGGLRELEHPPTLPDCTEIIVIALK